MSQPELIDLITEIHELDKTPQAQDLEVDVEKAFTKGFSLSLKSESAYWKIIINGVYNYTHNLNGQGWGLNNSNGGFKRRRDAIDFIIASFHEQVHFTDSNGSEHWYLNGKKHREDGPAMIWYDGTQEWWLNGVPHREDMPAIIHADGTQKWWLNGELHRDDGPAIINADGTQKWYLNGRRFNTQKEWEEVKRERGIES